MMSATLRFALLLLATRSVVVSSSDADAPVCPSSEGAVECRTLTENNQCGLYLAESTVGESGAMSLFTGIKRSAGDIIAEPDIIISVIDQNKNEYSPLHSFLSQDNLFRENSFFHDIFLPGVASMTVLQVLHSNNMVDSDIKERTDSVGVHRSSHPTAGSFSYHNLVLEAAGDLEAGKELMLSEDPHTVSAVNKGHSLEYLQENGICIDNFFVAKSSLPDVGRGAFAKRAVAAGQVIAPTPVVHFHRSDLDIVKQTLKKKEDHFISLPREHGIEYTEIVVGKQLLLNYCYGHPDSNLLLLPYAPGVNYINHNREKANAFVRWSTALDDDEPELKTLPVTHIFETPVGEKGTLVLEFVATRDITPGEEIFIDYGDAWVSAWEKHKSEWKPHDKNYVSAAEYNRLHGEEPIRTQEEQKAKPYPENLHTACYFKMETNEDGEEELEWSEEEDNYSCLRSCDVTKRYEDDGDTYYTAVVHSTKSAFEPKHCGNIPESGVTVTWLQEGAVIMVDRPYTSDTHLPNAFRHEIGVPDGLYPPNWMKADPNPEGDFIASPIAPGELAPIRWKGTGEVVTPWGFRLGMQQRIREVLVDYADKMGITEALRHLTLKENGLAPGESDFMYFHGYKWFLQRYNPDFGTNLHVLQPGDEAAQEHYYQAFSAAGFDESLRAIGETLGLDGLVIFHPEFWAVSHSVNGLLHEDSRNTGAKSFNVIIPLSLVNDTGPELDLAASDDMDHVGRYKYEYDVAVVNGDGAFHATSPVDYRQRQIMRLCASAYIIDVNEANVENMVLSDDFYVYPPSSDRELLLSWAGRHWKHGDPTKKLPEPTSDHILRQTATTK